MKRLALLAMLVSAPSWADSSLVLDTIPAPGPQTGERFDNNFKAIKSWTNLVESDGDNIIDEAERLAVDGMDCPLGQYPTGIDALGNATGCSPFSPGNPSNWEDPLPTTLAEGLDNLAENKSAILDLGTITETDYDPYSVHECVGPQCINLQSDGTNKVLAFSEVEGTTGWRNVVSGSLSNNHGPVLWAVANAANDTGTEVCAFNSMTCVDVLTFGADGTHALGADPGTCATDQADGTYYMVLCK